MNVFDAKKLSVEAIRQQKADGRVRVQDAITFKDQGISVEEARKKMLEAGEAPSGLLKESKKNAAVNPASIPVARPVDRQAQVVRPTSARITEVRADGTDGDSQTITAKTTVELDLAIRRISAKAQEQHKQFRVEILNPNEPEVVEEVIPEPVVEAVPVVAEPAKVETPAPAEAEVLETEQYFLEIRQEDGQWVAEIRYKNGAGKERFEAPSRKALMLKLLDGKANATLRVRKAIRREKYGVERDKTYTLPDGMTNEEFNAMSPTAQRTVIDALAATAGLIFRESHPEYYFTDENSMKVQKFLAHQNLPITVTNLEYAYAELAEDGELEARPEPKREIVVPKVAPAAVDSAPAAVAPTPAPAVVAAPAPAPEVRKRGTTGLKPGFSSAAPTELGGQEDGDKSKGPSEAELRSLPLDELRKRARKMYKSRQF